MRVIDCIQGSPEWLQARCGKVTASRISDVMAKIKSGEAACRRDYKYQIVAEILTGKPQENGYINAEMQWGKEQEMYARAAYEAKTNTLVDNVGFVIHPFFEERCGCSPDGLVGDDGLIEIKCPKTATHIWYLTTGNVPSDYYKQIQWQIACTDRKWCDFVSFDPRLPEEMKLFVKRVDKDLDLILEMEKEVGVFLQETVNVIKELKSHV